MQEGFPGGQLRERASAELRSRVVHVEAIRISHGLTLGLVDYPGSATRVSSDDPTKQRNLDGIAPVSG